MFKNVSSCCILGIYVDYLASRSHKKIKEIKFGGSFPVFLQCGEGIKMSDLRVSHWSPLTIRCYCELACADVTSAQGADPEEPFYHVWHMPDDFFCFCVAHFGRGEGFRWHQAMRHGWRVHVCACVCPLCPGMPWKPRMPTKCMQTLTKSVFLVLVETK